MFMYLMWITMKTKKKLFDKDQNSIITYLNIFLQKLLLQRIGTFLDTKWNEQLFSSKNMNTIKLIAYCLIHTVFYVQRGFTDIQRYYYCVSMNGKENPKPPGWTRCQIGNELYDGMLVWLYNQLQICTMVTWITILTLSITITRMKK